MRDGVGPRAGHVEAAARAAESVLTIVPSDALAVAVVKNPSEADAKVQKLAGMVQTPVPSPFAQLKALMGIQKGLDEKGALAVIAFSPSSGETEPGGVFVIPVTDYKGFITQFKGAKPDERITEIEVAGEKGFAARRGGYALLGFQKGRKPLEKVLDVKQSIAGELAGIEPWLNENDAAFVATRAGIQWATAKAQKELKKVEEQFGKIDADFGGQMATVLAVFQFYGKVLAVAEKEVSLAAAAVSADDQGTVRLTGRLRFVKDSKLGEGLAGIKPAEQDLMAGLPGGPFVVSFGATTPAPLMKRLAALGVELMQKSFSLYGLNPEQTEQLAKNSMQLLEQMEAMSIVMKTGRRGEPIYSNMFGAMRVDNAPRHIEQYEKQMEAQNRILKEAKDGILKPMEMKKVQIGGRPALELEVTIPIPKTDGENPVQQMQQSMMQAMFGPNNRMKMYLAAANETTVVLGYGTTPEKVGEAVELVRGAKPGLAADKDVAVTAALMPAGAQWVAYVSPRGYVSLIQRMMQQMMAGMQEQPGFQGPPAMPAVPSFPQTPPVGMAVKAAPGGLEATIVVPSAVLKAAGEYTATLRQATTNPQIP
ncbi:MAG: hypothetical protein ABR915_24400 [Thermoguttaceae bacterium]